MGNLRGRPVFWGVGIDGQTGLLNALRSIIDRRLARRNRMKRSALSLAILTVLLLQACGDSTSAPKPTRIVITPFNTNMSSVGETVQYSARLEDQNGKPIEEAAFQRVLIRR